MFISAYPEYSVHGPDAHRLQHMLVWRIQSLALVWAFFITCVCIQDFLFCISLQIKYSLHQSSYMLLIYSVQLTRHYWCIFYSIQVSGCEIWHAYSLTWLGCLPCQSSTVKSQALLSKDVCDYSGGKQTNKHTHTINQKTSNASMCFCHTGQF